MKKIAPIIITIIAVGYFSIYLGMFFLVEETSGIGNVFLAFFGLVGIGLIITMIYTLVTRLREIDKEDKDDLSKY